MIMTSPSSDQSRRYIMGIRIMAFTWMLVSWMCMDALQGQPLRRLSAAVNSLQQDTDLLSANWGVCVMEVNTGKVVLGYNIQKSLVTASVMKAVTTATALAILGPDFEFETAVEYDGQILPNGYLEGNLYVRGSGDPSLGSDRLGEGLETESLLNNWAKRLSSRGIRGIRGYVVADASVFDTQLTPGNWNWEDMGNYYGAGVSGVNINENLYRLDFKSGQTNGAATTILRTDPFMSELTFVNEVRTGPYGSGDNAYIYGSPYTATRFVRGTIPPNRPVFSIKGSIPDPAHFLARRFHELLGQCNVDLAGGTYTTSLLKPQLGNRPRTRLFVHRSPYLSELVKYTNHESINLYAEAFLKAIAVKEGSPGSTREGIKVLKDYWESQGVSTEGMLVRDGSGLSANNALTPFQIASILFKAYHAEYRDAYFQSLPVAGVSGTMKGVGRGTAAQGRLRAKSGFLSGVRSYAGYVTSRTGSTYAFVMIANYYSCSAGEMRRKFEQLMIALAEGN